MDSKWSFDASQGNIEYDGQPYFSLMNKPHGKVASDNQQIIKFGNEVVEALNSRKIQPLELARAS